MPVELISAISVIEGSIHYFIAGVFVVAAFHKLAGKRQFNKVLNDYQILPASFVNYIAPVLPVVELSIALFLCAGVWFSWADGIGVSAAIILFSVYTGALVKLYFEGKALEDCGCGGSANQPVSLWPILRNTVLIVACIGLYFGEDLAPHSISYSMIAVCLAIVLSLIYWTIEELYKNSYLILLLERRYD